MLSSPGARSSLETPEDEIDQQYLLIFKSRFRLSRLSIPHMVKARNGSVIYIGVTVWLSVSFVRSAARL